MLRRAVLSAIIFILVCPRLASPQNVDVEYRVKAVYLFNFLKFIEWPPGTTGSPLVIGVLGHDPFREALDSVVRGRTVKGRPVEIRRYSKRAQVKGCNILFIGHGDFERFGVPMQPGLLTVGESRGFLRSGGIIDFYLEDHRVHFEIEPSVARSAGLHLSSQLLKLGKML